MPLQLESGQLWCGEPTRIAPGLDRLIKSVEEGRVHYQVAYELEDMVVTAADRSCLVKTFKAWIRREQATLVEVKAKVVPVQNMLDLFIGD